MIIEALYTIANWWTPRFTYCGIFCVPFATIFDHLLNHHPDLIFGTFGTSIEPLTKSNPDDGPHSFATLVFCVYFYRRRKCNYLLLI